MLREFANTLIKSLRAIVLFDDLRDPHGPKQVYGIVAHTGGGYVSYSLIDSNDKYLGPVGLRKATVETKVMETWLDAHEELFESVIAVRVDVIESCFVLQGDVETVIEGIDIWSKDGRTIRLRREGAIYPYGLVVVG